MGHFIIQAMGVTTLKGDWSISHLRVLIAIELALQKIIKNRLNPSSRPIPVTNKLNIPPKDFHMGPSNGMYLRQILESSQERGLISGYSYPSRASIVEVQLSKEMMDKKRFFFPADMQSFYDNITVSDGTGAYAEEYVMLGLRLSEGISFDDYKKFFYLPFPEAALNTAAKYQKYGLVRISDKGISLTKSGFLVSNSIIADILNYI